MPSWVRDEDKWKKAKAIVKKNYGKTEADKEVFWKLVTGAYKRMGGETSEGVQFELKPVNETNVVYDVSLAKAKIASGGYSSFAEMMEKEYGIVPKHYKDKMEGVIDILPFAFAITGRKKNVRINRFMYDLGGQFKFEKDLLKLNKDPDGFSFTPTVIAKAGTSKPSTGSKPTVVAPKAVDQSAPSTQSAQGQDLVYQGVPEPLIYKFSNAPVEVSFSNSDKKSDRYDVVVSLNGKDIVKDSASVLKTSGLTKPQLWVRAYELFIVPHLSKLFKGLIDPLTVKVFGYEFEATLDKGSLANGKVTLYKVRALSTGIRGKFKDQDIAVIDFESLAHVKDNLISGIADILKKDIRVSTLYVGNKSFRAVRGIRKGSKMHKEIEKWTPKFDINVPVEFAVVLDANRYLVAIDVIVVDVDGDVSVQGRKKFIDTVRGNHWNNVKSEVADAGIDRRGNSYVRFRIIDDALLSSIYNDLRLEESMNIRGVGDNLELVREDTRRFYNHRQLVEYYGSEKIIGSEVEMSEGIYENYLVIDSSITDEEITEMLDSNPNMHMVYSNDDGAYIAYDQGLIGDEEILLI